MTAADGRGFRVGVDTGGTFTDLVLVNPDGTVVATHKHLSTPSDPSVSVLSGVDALLSKHGRGLGREDVCVTHGSTVATNALLEADHASTVFVTTAGFEDTLHLARQNRPDLYALVPKRPAPPIQRSHCIGVRERVGHDGRVIESLSDAEVSCVVSRAQQLEPASIALSLLHSYANPNHEQRLATTLREAFPGVPVTVSHELHPQFREYERAAVCVVNAVVAPKMTRYIRRLDEALGESELRIMGSHGGTISVDDACREPVRTILSGPAGGVTGAAALGPNLITLDMGGTSTDVAVIDDAPSRSGEHEAGGMQVPLPMVDIHTVGAGGGSIAWLDAGGALRVGPKSAGADPGPACYGRQDGEPVVAVTDAHVALGHLPDGYPLGDGLVAQRQPALDAVAHLARQASMQPDDLARGVLRVAELNMARAVHRVTLQRGKDPRGYTLVPFGGAGGLHACGLADQLGIKAVRVPVHPGLLSAVGMLAAPPLSVATRSLHWTIPPGKSEPDLSGVLKSLANEALAGNAAGCSESWIDYEVAFRYAGQSHEMVFDVDEAVTTERGVSGFAAYFHCQHHARFGFSDPGRAVELVWARAWARGEALDVKATQAAELSKPSVPAQQNVIDRSALAPEERRHGPLTVTEYSATTLVHEGWTLTVEADGTLRLERDE